MTELTYKASGVDVEAARKAVQLARKEIESTQVGALAIPHGFFTGAMYLPDWVRNMKQPILLGNHDGIGTLTYEAKTSRKYMERMGYSVANHNFMDLACSGGRPVMFLNTIDWHAVQPELQAAALKGMARSCREVGAVLLGGETASLPILIRDGESIINAAAVGFVDENEKIDGPALIQHGDIIIGLCAIGVHINGLSLCRRVIFEKAGLGEFDIIPGSKRTILDELTRGTPNYARYLLPFIAEFRKHIHGIFNVTGEGIPGNLVRILPRSTEALIYRKRLPRLPIFKFISAHGVSDTEMWHTFNLGIGVGIVTGRKSAQLLLKVLAGVMPKSLSPVVIGHIQKSVMSEPTVSLVNAVYSP